MFYDAAAIDGASRLRQFLHITLPLLKPVTLFVIVTQTISSMQVFVPIFVMTEGGPFFSTNAIVYYIYQNGFALQRHGVRQRDVVLRPGAAGRDQLRPVPAAAQRHGVLTDGDLHAAHATDAAGALARPAGRAEGLRLGQIAEPIGRYALYAIITVIFLLPFLWMFFGSVRREIEIHGLMFPFGWHTIVPVEWTLQNFLDIFGISEEGSKGGLQFHRGLMNSAHHLGRRRRCRRWSSTRWRPTSSPGCRSPARSSCWPTSSRPSCCRSR